MSAPPLPPALRVALCQPLLPAYRVPVFSQLAAHPRVQLTLFAGQAARTSSLKGAEAPAHLTVRPAPRPGHRGLFVQPQALLGAAAGPFDVLILPWVLREVHLAPALALARARGLAVLLWGHGYSKNEAPLRRRLRNLVGRAAHGLLFYNRLAADLCAAEGFDPQRLFVAPNALDQAPIRAARSAWTPEALRAFAAAHDLHPPEAGGGTLLFSSRLEADKRAERLIDVLAILAPTRPRLRVIFIGDGPQRAALERSAAQRGLAHAVRFVGALYDEAALAPWFLSADLFTYPAAIGLSLLHAFGYGLPALTSDQLFAHNPEIEALRPGYNGLLYREGDPAHFAAQVTHVLDDPALRARLRANAQASIEGPHGYTIERMVAGFVAAIEAVHALRRS